MKPNITHERIKTLEFQCVMTINCEFSIAGETPKANSRLVAE